MGKPKSVKIAHAKGARKKSSARGQAYGSRRGIPDKQVHRKEVRYADGRVVQSMEEARREQEALERRIAHEQQQPTIGATPGAEYVARRAEEERAAALEADIADHMPKPKVERHRYEPYEGEPKPGWTVGQARAMIREGYKVTQVMRLSGVGYKWLDDLPLDDEGRIRASAVA